MSEDRAVREVGAAALLIVALLLVSNNVVQGAALENYLIVLVLAAVGAALALVRLPEGRQPAPEAELPAETGLVIAYPVEPEAHHDAKLVVHAEMQVVEAVAEADPDSAAPVVDEADPDLAAPVVDEADPDPADETDKREDEEAGRKTLIVPRPTLLPDNDTLIVTKRPPVDPEPEPPEAEHDEPPVQELPVQELPVQDAPVQELPVQDAPADDLERISGIGPKIAAALREIGVTTFAGLAASDETQLQRALEAVGAKRLGDPKFWIAQARYAAANDWDGVQRVVDSYKNGRESD